MRLRSLDIKGFKSFADKTHILLDHPITGIVGPNGCGKSNIVDAIRWVIGEHKIKALRSDNLEDLIFNGSKTRNASGLAEVSLTFENTRNLLPTEFTTVTITRKFYKNGESEYRLNDVACRLKDIHNLFLDTGVSSDSYAIIELGMVDDIIKDKEGARRRMLEQAAGISIYKTRKKEAKQKLEGTEQDLARIEDLLFEISNNVRTLELQAKKAERYYAVKADYKEISIELAKASLEAFNDQYNSLNDQFDRESDRKTQIEAAVATEEASLEQQKVQLISREQELAGLQKRFNELLQRIRHLENEKKLASQRVEYLSERIRSLNELLTKADNQSGLLSEAIAWTERQLAEEAALLEALSKDLAALREQVDEQRGTYDERKKTLELLRQSFHNRQRSLFEAEKKVAVADASIANWLRSMQQIAEEQNSRAAQISQFRQQQTDATNQLGQLEAQLQIGQHKRGLVQSEMATLQQTLEQQRTALQEANRKLDSRSNEHELLRSLVNSLEGYPESIKFLKKNNSWSPGAPLLSDVLVVADPYRKALEAVLDNYLNYYVVQEPREAMAAIGLLSSQKKGKANFFVMRQLPGEARASGELAAGLTPALQVIEVDEAYTALAAHLLSHVFIADAQLDLSAVELPVGSVIVSVNGDRMLGHYTIGGGSVGAFDGNKIGRAKNLERLEIEIASLRTQNDELKQDIAQTQRLIADRNRELNDKSLEQIKQEINKLQNTQVTLGHRIEHLEQLGSASINRAQQMEHQIEQTRNGIAQTQLELKATQADLQGMQAQIVEAERAFAAVERLYNETNQRYNQQNILYTRQQSKLDGLRREKSIRQAQLQELQNQINSNREQQQQATLQLAETEGKLHGGDAEMMDLLAKREKDERILNEADRSYYDLRNAIATKESQLMQKRREKEQADTLLYAVKDKLNEMRLRLAGLKERLHVEFRVHLDDILDEPRKLTLDVQALTAESERLKKRLENIGEVNPTAIEAYTEMKGRFDFISEQKTDLVNARASLLATIEQVEQTANRQFRETFEAVRKNFIDVFQALFTHEDNCDLRLADPDHVAESDIEIYAQPKGKKPSTLTQLSGGEKTLTSTAFLFAIYLIKPAPFCILDEVDAPLDDANVGKFTNMIRQFSDNSQFIIVTHNKQTMAAVDVVYGVTMQEPGVSKLVPVDFRSLN